MSCKPTLLESKLYPLRLLRAPLPMREVALELAEATDGPTAELPDSDEDLSLWMLRWLKRPELSNDETINYWMGYEYIPSMGFLVAVDACSRLQKSLPCAAVHSLAPPGSFYAESPLVEDVKITHGFDLKSELRSPHWTDGYQRYENVEYNKRLILIIDVRGLLKSGSTVPMGWAVLPIFDKRGPYVNSGGFQLPLFAGVPSQKIIDELTEEFVEDALARALKQERLRYTSSNASVYVRLLDAQWEGLQREPLHAPREQRKVNLPPYVQQRDRAEFRVALSSKTYVEGAMPKAELFSQAMSPEGWATAMGAAFMKSLGLPMEEDLGFADVDLAGSGLLDSIEA